MKHFIYPGHGLVRLIRTDTRVLSGKKKSFLVLTTAAGMTIMTPGDELKKPYTPRKITNALRDKPTTKTNGTWNRRYRDFMEQLSSGDFKKIFFVARCLRDTQKNNDLSFGERKMWEQCIWLLTLEYALAFKVSKTVAETTIREKIKND